jgi:hypothetical protein
MAPSVARSIAVGRDARHKLWSAGENAPLPKIGARNLKLRGAFLLSYFAVDHAFMSDTDRPLEYLHYAVTNADETQQPISGVLIRIVAQTIVITAQTTNKSG